MTLTQLSYVVAVADHRGFAHAANACFITQPTLSMQIQKLEDELGVTLFDRSKQPVEPTAVGEVIIAQARIVLRDASQITELVKNQTKEVSGAVSIGVIPTLAPYLLPLFVQRLVKEYPKLRLTIHELQTDQIVQQINSGKLDLGILVTPLNSNQIVEHVLFNEPFYLYASPDHELLKRKSIQKNDLNSGEIWLLSDGHCFRDQALSLCRDVKSKADESNFRFESGNLETLKKMVDQGAGYTLLPHLAIKDLVHREQKERVKDFASPVPTREVSLIHNQHYTRTAIIEAITAEICKSLPKDVLNLKKAEIRTVPL